MPQVPPRRDKQPPASFKTLPLASCHLAGPRLLELLFRGGSGRADFRDVNTGAKG